MKYRLGELFCGPGGIASGALSAEATDGKESHGFTHAWASDYHRQTCDTYIRNICPDSPDTVHCEDVRQLDISKLGEVEGFAYGFPCNDFSIVGESKGFEGEFGPLYSYGLPILERFNPLFFLAENVSGLGNSSQKLAFEQILKDLKEAGSGYRITPHMHKAEEYGVPQSRHRIIVVGIRSDLGQSFKVPKPIISDGNYITARMALEDKPIPATAANNELTRQSPVVVERLKHIKPGQNAWTADLPDELKLNVKGARLSQIYKRLDPDRPSYTVTGSGGGGTHGYHWQEPRALTNRERARLQSFDDTFVFEGSKESVRRQIGMAVPPVLAHHIFEAILYTLHDIPYDNIPANLEE